MGVRKVQKVFLTVYIHLAVFRVLYVVLLRHDDVFNVFHGEVVAEGVVQEPLQLFHRQLLHVTLQTHAEQDEHWSAATGQHRHCREAAASNVNPENSIGAIAPLTL